MSKYHRDEDTENDTENDSTSESEPEYEERAVDNDNRIHNELESLVSSIKCGEIEPSEDKFKDSGSLSTAITGQSESTKECILHFLVKETVRSNERARMAQAIRCIAHYQPQLLTVHSESRQTALYLALENMNSHRAHLLLFGLLKREKMEPKLKRKDLAKAIEKRCGPNDENCLHRALRVSPLQLHVGVVERLVSFASANAINATDSTGATPLHRAVKYELSSAKMLDIIRNMLKRAESEPDKGDADTGPKRYAFDARHNVGSESFSVYEYHLKTRDEFLFKQNEAMVKAKEKVPKQREPPKSSASIQDGLQWNDEQERGNEDQKNWSSGQSKHHRAVTKHESIHQSTISTSKGVNGNRDDAPEQGITRSNTGRQNANGIPAPGETERAKHSAGKPDEEELKKWSDEICKELKLHCLRTRTIAQAKQFLYGTKKDGPQLYFDYRGLNEENIIPDRFSNSFHETKFDPILQYVQFPAIRLNKEKDIMPRCQFFKEFQVLYDSHMIGRNDVLFFFAWLSKEKQVKQIIKVIVDDFKDPHSDDIIEKCLSLFTIDVLDWSKPDLDPDLIYNACPDVQELHLRWGGNNAVLRAWSERDGLPRLKKLRRVMLHYDKASERVRRQVEVFKKRLSNVLSERSSLTETNRPTSLQSASQIDPEGTIKSNGTDTKRKKKDGGHSANRTIEVVTEEGSQLLGQGIDSETSGRPSNGLDAVPHRWLDSIDDFSGEFNTFLNKIKRLKHAGDEIKVALIDDGIGFDDKAFRNRAIPGKSFGYYSSDAREKQWYVSETGHGTVMAHMILRVCPMAKIYPIRLDTSSDFRGGSLRIQPESTIKAIEAAIECKVNIISMSWTVNKPNNDIKKEFDAVLARATEAGILMFCSSPDEGQYSGETYPAAYGQDALFRIGAAQADGNPYSWVSVDKVDYIFPGVDVVRTKSQNIELRSVETPETGSSISTALAAGLAALVLWFIRIGVVYTSENQDNQRRDGRIDGLEDRDFKTVQSYKGMKYAFTQLGADQGPNEKYVEIWSTLDERTRKLQMLHGSPEEAREEICRLARNLVKK